MDRFLDYAIIVTYLIGITIFGIVKGGKQSSEKDYFLGSKKVPWWAACFSIVAAETSTLTFISIPGLAYLTNLNFLQLTIGYVIGRIFVAYFFLPSYFKGELNTAYAYLEHRFGLKTRKFASTVFLFTRTAADGVRLFATAIPLKLLLDIDYLTAIIIIAGVALVYTSFGGVGGIIWVDVLQMGIYLGGAVIAGIFILNYYLPENWLTILNTSSGNNKFEIFNFGFNNGLSGFFQQPYNLFSGLIGGTLLSMATHGTDQLIVQRLLAVKDLKNSQKAIIASGIVVVIQFAIFLILGLLLYAYYNTLDLSSIGINKADEIFPKFIIEVLPVGVSGLIIAGLFAAAISTIAGSISSLSSSTIFDIFGRYTEKYHDSKKLFMSRIVSVLWTVLLVISALFFMSSSQIVVELALSIASFTYGGLLGTFLLGLFVKDAKQEDALAGFTAGIFVMLTVIFLNVVAWTWFILIGAGTTILVGFFLTFLSKSK